MFELIAAVVLLVVSVLITMATAPKPVTPKPAAFEDFDFPQVDESTPQAVVFGDVWIEDWMVLWYGDYSIQPIKKGGKK